MTMEIVEAEGSAVKSLAIGSTGYWQVS